VTTANRTQLELSRVDDIDELANRIEEFYKQDSSVKSSLAYNWERNHLFLDGKHWIIYDGERGQGGEWKQLSVHRSNEYIPRPVTNYVFDVYQTLKAYLVQHKPRSSVTSNTQAYRDKMAAKIATLICEANWERLGEERNYDYAASVCLTYGTVFKKDYWDMSTVSMARVPRVEPTPVIDPQTGQVVGMEEREAVDENGDVIIDEIPLGDLNTSIIEPYRISLDPLCVGLHDARWILESSIQPLDWIEEQFGREDEGFTGRIAEVKEETLST